MHSVVDSFEPFFFYQAHFSSILHVDDCFWKLRLTSWYVTENRFNEFLNLPTNKFNSIWKRKNNYVSKELLCVCFVKLVITLHRVLHMYVGIFRLCYYLNTKISKKKWKSYKEYFCQSCRVCHKFSQKSLFQTSVSKMGRTLIDVYYVGRAAIAVTHTLLPQITSNISTAGDVMIWQISIHFGNNLALVFQKKRN